jgi:undecaprenyl-diphosphatase
MPAESVSSPEPLPATEEAQRVLTAALLVGLLVAAAAAMLLTWLGDEVMEGDVLGVDSYARSLVHTVASPGLTKIMWAASRFGGPSVLVPAGLLAAAAFLVRGWRRGALLAVITLAGAGLLNWSLKLSFGRVRPEAFFDYPLPGSPSFPSGHALFAASVFGGLAALLSPRLKHHALKIAVWSAALLLILLVGLSRIYFGVHYPSDVLAGYSVAVIWVTSVALGDRLRRHRRRRR